MARPDAKKYADQLAVELTNIGVEVPADFERLFLRQVSRVGYENFSDLGALLTIDCLVAKRDGKAFTSPKDVQRALDRVRHRLTRESTVWRDRHQVLFEYQAVTPAESSAPELASDREMIAVLQTALSALSARDHLAIEKWMDGAAAREIADTIGVTEATARQVLHRALGRIRQACRP